MIDINEISRLYTKAQRNVAMLEQQIVTNKKEREQLHKQMESTGVKSLEEIDAEILLIEMELKEIDSALIEEAQQIENMLAELENV